MNRRTAWILARLIADRDTSGMSAALPPPYDALAVRLANLPPEVRRPAFEGFLAGHPDPDALTAALAAVDPEGPPPDAEPDAPEDAKAPPRFKLTCAADVTPRPVDWLWEGRVPLGMLTLFAGDPKLGKSFVTLGLAATVSRGAPMPDTPNVGTTPGAVVILSAEDDLARTIVPRLQAAGADRSRIHVLESVYLADGLEALPSLRSDCDAIEGAIEASGDCRLVIVDPVSAYLGGTDDHRNAELRGLLSPLKALAERRGVAVVLVTHLNKGAGTNAKHRVTGSIAYVGACRANYLFVRDREDATGRRVLMCSIGVNVAPDPATLAYRIEDRGDGPAVEWEADPVSITAEQALAAEADAGAEQAERSACEKWLRETLAAGPVPSRDVEKAGKDAGFNLTELKRAKTRIGAVSKREGFGANSKCHWSLPKGDGRPQ
jgi:putative DNA primase/helicase